MSNISFLFPTYLFLILPGFYFMNEYLISLTILNVTFFFYFHDPLLLRIRMKCHKQIGSSLITGGSHQMVSISSDHFIGDPQMLASISLYSLVHVFPKIRILLSLVLCV